MARLVNGPTMAKMLGVRGTPLVVGAGGVTPPASALGIRVMSMDLLLADDATPLAWQAPSQAEAHTWRGAMEANALREFLADTDWGTLDLLLVDLPPGTDRLATVLGLLMAPPKFQCAGNDFEYDPASGTLSLTITDDARC